MGNRASRGKELPAEVALLLNNCVNSPGFAGSDILLCAAGAAESDRG
jgi:hypothetical protein